jgi:PAS domain S-box-containing protein
LTFSTLADKLGPGQEESNPVMARSTDSSVLLDTLLNAAVDAIIVADVNGRMIRVNPAAATMFGYAPDDMTGQSIDMLVPETELVDHRTSIANYLATGRAKIIGIGRDVEAVRKDGSIFPAHLSVGHGTIGGRQVFVGFLHDLTGRQQAQQAVETAQRMEALARLTGGVAHDFNNLLTIIIGNLELLDAKLVDSEQKALLHEALSAAELGTKVIEKLLIHGRRGPLQPVILDTNIVIRETLNLLSHTLSPHIKLRVALGTEIWPINADPAQVQNVLINLVVNAQDAMPEAGEIVISSSNVEADRFIAEETGTTPGRYVRISVTDNGQGMTPEVKQRAFEPFFTTKAPGKGTGLGLATVYGFVRQSGGHVTLYSEVGLGTTISLHFPAAAGTPATPDHGLPEAVGKSDSGQTILVVEDDDAILRLSVSRIEALGYRALPAADAQEAMAILASNTRIDALFTDIVMPGAMNGLDLARKVRAERPEIAILLTSGFSGDLIHPGNGFSTNFQLLSKPYRQDELATRLRILLSGHSS